MSACSGPGTRARCQGSKDEPIMVAAFGDFAQGAGERGGRASTGHTSAQNVMREQRGNIEIGPKGPRAS